MNTESSSSFRRVRRSNRSLRSSRGVRKRGRSHLRPVAGRVHGRRGPTYLGLVAVGPPARETGNKQRTALAADAAALACTSLRGSLLVPADTPTNLRGKYSRSRR